MSEAAPPGINGHHRSAASNRSAPTGPLRLLLQAIEAFCSKRALLCATVIFMVVQPATAQSTLGSGASSLQETYQDWQVTCAVRENAPTCVMLQDQSQQNGERLLAVEVQMRSDGSAIATLLLPFGISLDSGVTPQIDDQPPLSPLRFRTCLPTGCLAPLPLDSSTLTKLRAGTRLNLEVTTAADTELSFPVSLLGFSAALERLAALSRR